MPTDRVECLDCGEQLTPSTTTCPKCGSNKKRFYKFVNETIRFRVHSIDLSTTLIPQSFCHLLALGSYAF
jgi:ribosomal protein L40E